MPFGYTGNLRNKEPACDAGIAFNLAIQPERQPRALQQGAAGYIRKDAGMVEFAKAITDILAGRKYVTADLAASLANYFHPAHAPKAHDQLSEREFHVLQKIGRGVQLKQIAAELCLSPKSISTYRARVMEKLKLRTITDLVRYCVDHGLVDQ